jgi:hypothetical protein
LNPNYKKTLFAAAGKAGINAAAKSDLLAFFIYKSLEFLKPGGRLGFVVSGSWLTSDYGASLQFVLLQRLRLLAIVSSSVESFFSQVQVNTVLIIAEKRAKTETEPDPDEIIKFVRLNKKLDELLDSKVGEYWNTVLELVDSVELATGAFANEDFQVTPVLAQLEREALAGAPTKARNWSVYLRAPLSYFEIFGVIQ